MYDEDHPYVTWRRKTTETFRKVRHMSKVHLFCGKICSGKTWYAEKNWNSSSAVILSRDEVTYDLVDNQLELGEGYDAFAKRVNRYLRKKAVQIVHAGADMILDWGFWTKADRMEISEYFRARDITCVWYYMDVSDEQWEKNIAERNRRVENGKADMTSTWMKGCGIRCFPGLKFRQGKRSMSGSDVLSVQHLFWIDKSIPETYTIQVLAPVAQ